MKTYVESRKCLSSFKLYICDGQTEDWVAEIMFILNVIERTE